MVHLRTVTNLSNFIDVRNAIITKLNHHLYTGDVVELLRS